MPHSYIARYTSKARLYIYNVLLCVTSVHNVLLLLNVSIKTSKIKKKKLCIIKKKVVYLVYIIQYIYSVDDLAESVLDCSCGGIKPSNNDYCTLLRSDAR